MAGAIVNIDQLLTDPELSDQLKSFVVALRAIAAGSRDRGLADAPALDYSMAAELLLPIDTLEAAAGAA